MMGLTSGEAQRLAGEGKNNRIRTGSQDSVGRIVFQNVFTYFNAIFCLLSVLLIITGSFKNLTFMVVIIANVFIGIIQRLKAKKVLDELALLDVSEYDTYRDGALVKVASEDLVQGDVIELPSGRQIPADAVVVSGEAGVNESLLTGEADEVEKKEGSELKSGSFIASGSVTARLTHVGADSYAAKLTEKAKAHKTSRSEMINAIERIVKVAGILIIPVGFGLFYQSYYVKGEELAPSVSSMVGAVVGMIPEGLYLLVTIALALSAARLAKSHVLLHDMKSVEMLARVDVLCVDKTGTITSDVMKVSEVFIEADGKAADLLRSYINTVPDANITMKAMREHFGERGKLDAVSVMPFSSKTKYSQIECKDCIYRLGAPEFLMDEGAMSAYKKAIEERTGQGKRVLAFVKVSGEETVPLLFVALHNEIRENARDTFKGFAQQGVKIKVISGDNPLTVSRVATQAGVENADRYVDASTLNTPEKIKDAAMLYTVFGRVKPEQKKELVEALRGNGLKVAMTGDGVNDILAMKEADCSIAMGGGSDAARQAAQVVLLDSDFSHMKQIVSEGRRDINNITRSAILFLYKNIFSLLMALFSLCAQMAYPLQPTQVSLISAFNIGLPAFLLAFEANERKQQGGFISRTLSGALPAALTSFFAIVSMQLFAMLFDIDAADVGKASTYLLSAVGFLILFNLARPLNKWRITVIVVCIVGFFLAGNVFRSLFDLADISIEAGALCMVFAFAEVSVMQILTIGFRLAGMKGLSFARIKAIN